MKEIKAFLIKILRNKKVFNIAQTDSFETEGYADAVKMTTLFLCDRCKNYSKTTTNVNTIDKPRNYNVCDFCFEEFNKYFKD